MPRWFDLCSSFDVICSPFLARLLKVIDQGHIFTCGKPLTQKLADIEMIKEEQLYGCFPFFRNSVTVEHICQCAAELKQERLNLCGGVLDDLPAAWEVSIEARQAVGRFLLERAVFLADNIKAIAENALNTETPYQNSQIKEETNE